MEKQHLPAMAAQWPRNILYLMAQKGPLRPIATYKTIGFQLIIYWNYNGKEMECRNGWKMEKKWMRNGNIFMSAPTSQKPMDSRSDVL